jgi:hypothetical protein
MLVTLRLTILFVRNSSDNCTGFIYIIDRFIFSWLACKFTVFCRFCLFTSPFQVSRVWPTGTLFGITSNLITVFITTCLFCGNTVSNFSPFLSKDGTTFKCQCMSCFHCSEWEQYVRCRVTRKTLILKHPVWNHLTSTSKIPLQTVANFKNWRF